MFFLSIMAVILIFYFTYFTDDWTIPKGAEIVVFPWGTCQSRLNWGPDAREFIPERWFRPNQPDPVAFNAFSYGRRICIGKTIILIASCFHFLSISWENHLVI